MIIDLHFHTARFSECSRIPLEAGVQRAREKGLDAICLTEHDCIGYYPDLKRLEKRYGLRIFVGVEIFTLEGDLICYGLETVPGERLHARELTKFIHECGGASIAAHPFRDNGRGMGSLFLTLPHLTAVEGLNGNTTDISNLRAQRLARGLGLPLTGGSDAHLVEQVGCYATEFYSPIKNIQDLSAALGAGECCPLDLRDP